MAFGPFEGQYSSCMEPRKGMGGFAVFHHDLAKRAM